MLYYQQDRKWLRPLMGERVGYVASEESSSLHAVASLRRRVRREENRVPSQKYFGNSEQIHGHAQRN